MEPVLTLRRQKKTSEMSAQVLKDSGVGEYAQQGNLPVVGVLAGSFLGSR